MGTATGVVLGSFASPILGNTAGGMVGSFYAGGSMGDVAIAGAIGGTAGALGGGAISGAFQGAAYAAIYGGNVLEAAGKGAAAGAVGQFVGSQFAGTTFGAQLAQGAAIGASGAGAYASLNGDNIGNAMAKGAAVGAGSAALAQFVTASFNAIAATNTNAVANTTSSGRIGRSDVTKAFNWLKTNHPELTVDMDPSKIHIVSIPDFFDVDALTFGKTIFLDSSIQSMDNLVNTMSHELMHVQTGSYMDNVMMYDKRLPWGEANHNALHDKASQIEMEYWDYERR